jgi:flagellin
MGLASKLAATSAQTGRTSANIASGSRINRAAADAAGLAIAMKMQSHIGGTGQAIRNVSDGMSLLQTAEGALGGTQEMLGRVEMLSVQAANGTLTDSQRGFIQMEIDQIKSEINRVASSTGFNGISLLDGSLSQKNGGITFQIGADNVPEERFDVEIEAMNSTAIGIAGLNVTTSQSAQSAIESAKRAISFVSEQRASLGAAQNRLEHTVNNLTTASENLTASKSRIADADMALEMTEYMRSNILQQAQIAMMAHKIREPQGLMQLLNQGASADFRV